MNIILNNDHTVKKVSKFTKTNTKDMKYAIIDISTVRKGPLYTLVTSINYDFKDIPIDIGIDISYAEIDVPCDNNTILQTTFSTDSMEKYYNIFPLIKQMFAFNIYREKNSNIDNQLFIDSIQIQYGKEYISINEYDSDKHIDKIFRKLKLKTQCNTVLSDELLVISNKKWEIKPYILLDDHFDKIGIPIPFTESMYLLSFEDYIYFMHTKRVSVEVSYPGLNDHDDSEYRILDASTFIEILELCMFIPQMILMEQKIYGNAIKLTLIIETSYGIRTLVIDDKETPFDKNMCIFKLIKKLLKM